MTRRRGRSWVDVVVGGIDRLPGPPWVAYAVLILLTAGITVALRMLDGGPVGVLNVVFAALTFTPFAVMHAINDAARRAMAEFRPALGDLEPEYDELERRLTTTSVATGIVGALSGLAIITAGTLTVDGEWGVGPENSLATNIVTFVSEVILNAGIVSVLLHQLGQVRTIGRIHRESTNIELWNVRPHNAFARVTVIAAIAITVLYVSAAIGSVASTRNSGLAIVIMSIVIVIVTLVFVGPLVGMRRRLVREKERQLGETDRVFQEVADRLRANADKGDIAAAAQLEGVISALVNERDRLKKVSTWPWSADTLRAFLTSLGVPIVLWLVTTLLGRLLFA